MWPGAKAYSVLIFTLLLETFRQTGKCTVKLQIFNIEMD